jgi:hypothetical protein
LKFCHGTPENCGFLIATRIIIRQNSCQHNSEADLKPRETHGLSRPEILKQQFFQLLFGATRTGKLGAWLSAAVKRLRVKQARSI